MQESDFFNQKVYLTRDMLKTLVHFSFFSLFSFNLYFIKTQIYPEYFATTEGKIQKSERCFRLGMSLYLFISEFGTTRIRTSTDLGIF